MRFLPGCLDYEDNREEDDDDEEEKDDENEDDGQSSVGISFGMSGQQSKLGKADIAKKVQQVTFQI